MTKFKVKKSRFVTCPQCLAPFLSRKGVFSSKTITCPFCGVEVLR